MDAFRLHAEEVLRMIEGSPAVPFHSGSPWDDRILHPEVDPHGVLAALQQDEVRALTAADLFLRRAAEELSPEFSRQRETPAIMDSACGLAYYSDAW